MKKYLALAALLGVIAFVSVSYLAQADEHAVDQKTEAAAPATAPVATFAQDHDACDMMAAAPSTEGVAPSAEVKDAAYTKCMMGKGHTEEEMKKAAEEKAAAEAAKAAETPAPAAPAAH